VINFTEGNWDLIGKLRAEADEPPAERTASTKQQLIRRVHRLVAFGELSKAFNAAQGSASILDIGDDEVRQLQHKYPGTRHSPTERRDKKNATTVHLPTKTWTGALRSINKSTAPGGDGLTREWIAYVHTDSSLSKYQHMMVNDVLPREYMSWCAGGPLTPLAKPDDTMRPIVPQSILVRVAGKGMLKAFSHEVVRALGPYQLAVGCPSGCDSMAFLARTWLIKNPDHVCISSDISNGYGSVRRTPLRADIDTNIPMFLNFFDAVYNNGYGNKVTYRDERGTLQVHTCNDGVQQGDPLAAMYFTLFGTRKRATVNENN
jgi:hypothetical protein